MTWRRTSREDVELLIRAVEERAARGELPSTGTWWSERVMITDKMVDAALPKPERNKLLRRFEKARALYGRFRD